ncbi:MAG: RNA polymerase sigma factor [Opitutaceae bacterium]|nr:RNA polymerase sigma factor [Opitutaceae bacterium]
MDSPRSELPAIPTPGLPGPSAVGMPNPSQWFTQEVQPHEPLLRSWLRGAFPAVRDVDDVVQESYLRLWRTHATRQIRSARAFLFTVARRVVLDELRRERRSPLAAVADPTALEITDERPGVLETAAVAEKLDAVADALMTLPPRCRAVVTLAKLKGLSRHEVAAHLGLSVKTVDEQLARGIRRLERTLRERGADTLFAS